MPPPHPLASGSAQPGFTVLYRWRLHEGKAEQFVEGWAEVSARLLAEGGSHGSRLHRGEDGLWYSYAQWPSAEARARAFAAPVADPRPGDAMRDAIAETLPEIVLHVVAGVLLLPKSS